MTRVLHTLADGCGKDTGVRVDLTTNEVVVRFDGFPNESVCVERYGGELRVLVWADVRSDDPTHVIVLADGNLTRLTALGVSAGHTGDSAAAAAGVEIDASETMLSVAGAVHASLASGLNPDTIRERLKKEA